MTSGPRRAAPPAGAAKRWLLLACVAWAVALPVAARDAPDWAIDIRRQTFAYGDATPTDIAWQHIEQGCPHRDCIPSIDHPVFMSPAEGFALEESELVIGLSMGDEARAYPVRILNYHEIVNDWIDGAPIAVAYCPLCGSGLVFRRALAAGTTTFGVSGLLHESDLILYDRRGASLWAQATGRAFAGPARGESLVEVPASFTTWGEWRASHPHTLVLQPPEPDDPAYRRGSPYGDYDRSRRLLFPVSRRSRALHPKEPVYGFDVDGGIAVSERFLRTSGCVELHSHDRLRRIERGPDGRVTMTLPESAPTARRMFWFAWYTFNPSTVLLDEDPTRTDCVPTADRARPAAIQN